MKKKYSTLYSKVEEILFKYDFMDINYGDNHDEYSPEVSTILPRVKYTSNINDIAKIIQEEFIHWFEEDIFINKETHDKLLMVAKEILKEWEKFNK